MRRALNRAKRFAWRAARNCISATGIGRKWLHPATRLAAAFGPADVDYSWRVFTRHAQQLRDLGFDFTARRILEIGPGRNLGSAVLWWAACGGDGVRVTLWDTFANMAPDAKAIRATTRALLDASEAYRDDWPDLIELLRRADATDAQARIEYIVSTPRAFAASRTAPFDLLLSHSVIEHIWPPEPTLAMLADLTAETGWQSMQIDLKDHGSRDTNYNFLEMLEWSKLAYWLTMAFIPGALNRWRAQQYIDLYEGLGLRIVAANRRIQDALPTKREHLAEPFRSLDDEELLTTELFLVTHGRTRALPAESA